MTRTAPWRLASTRQLDERRLAGLDLDRAAGDALLAQHRLDEHRARVEQIAATRSVSARRSSTRAHDAAAGLRRRHVELLRDAGRLRDLDVVRAVRARRELEPAQAVVDRRERRDGRAAIVDDLALDVGRLAERVLRHEVDAARHALDEVAALGEQRQLHRLHHDRDALLDRLGDAAVLGEDREQAVAARDLRGQLELRGRLAVACRS